MGIRGGADRLPPAFLRFWWAEVVSGFGSAVHLLALQTIVVVTLHGSAVEVGWLNAARWLPYLVLGLIVGALVDRVRRRPVMMVSDAVRAALLTVIPLTWAVDLLGLPVLLVVVVLFGTASLVNDAASLSYVTRLVPRHQLQRAHARLDTADAAAQTAGPAVAGAVIRLVGAPVAVLIDAATYVFSVVTLATLGTVREPASEPAGTERRPLRRLRGEIVEGARWAYGASGLARLAVATHVWFAAQGALLVVIAPYALTQLRLSPFVLGLVLAAGGVGAVVGAAVSTGVGNRLGNGGAVICSYAVSAVAVVVMAAAATVPTEAAAAVLAAGQLLHGWAMGQSNSHEMSLRQSRTPDALQARTNTTLRSLNRAVLVVVSPLAGLLAVRVGSVTTLLLSAAVFALAALLLVTSAFRRARVG